MVKTRVHRQCGECTLCCRLLPMQPESKSGYTHERIAELVDKLVKERLASRSEFTNMSDAFDKPAGARCKHQRHKGCAIYRRRPFSCRIWNCRWLGGADTGDLSRPDRAGYVLDIMPDYITLDPADGSERVNIEIIQVWIDPRRPQAWRHDRALWAYLERRGRDGIAGLIRSDARAATVLMPPAMSSDGQWHEITAGTTVAEHRDAELMSGLAQCQRVKLEVPVTTKTTLQERLDRIDRSAIVAKIRADLAYRLPQSGKALGHIVLKREEAKQLIEDIEATERENDE